MINVINIKSERYVKKLTLKKYVKTVIETITLQRI